MMRVVLADDHNLVRAGLRALLERMSDVEVVGEASDGRAALALIARGEASAAPRPAGIVPARQGEIRQLVAEGKRAEQIARERALSGKTVETHRAQIMERLRIHDVAGLVRYAIRAGLVSSEP